MTELTLTVEEVADELGISKWLAYKQVNTGKIPHIRMGRRIIIPRKKFNKWLEESSNKSDEII